MKFDKHGIAKVYKEPLRGISLGLISGFVGAAVGLSIGLLTVQEVDQLQR